jgi:hypothetical protein
VFLFPGGEFGLAGFSAVGDDQAGSAVAAVGDDRGAADGGRRGLRSSEDMMTLREPIYEAQRAFINTARQHLTHAMTPLRRLNGKPVSGDPIWAELGLGSATVHRRIPSPRHDNRPGR